METQSEIFIFYQSKLWLETFVSVRVKAVISYRLLNPRFGIYNSSCYLPLTCRLGVSVYGADFIPRTCVPRNA
jgi:hypothetical protein